MEQELKLSENGQILVKQQWELGEDSQVRVWKFGCKPPTQNADKVRDQLIAANVFYNECIKLEQERLKEFREIRAHFFPKLVILEKEELELKDKRSQIGDQIKEISRQVKQINHQLKNITHKVDVSELRLKKKKLQSEKQDLQEQKKKIAVSEQFKILRLQAKHELQSGDEEFKRRMNGAKTSAAGKLAPKVFLEMSNEDQWSDWWKAKETSQRFFIEAYHELCKKASHGTLIDFKDRTVAAIGDGVYNISNKCSKQAWTDYWNLFKEPTKAKAKAKAKAIQRGRPVFKGFDGSGQIGVQIKSNQVKITNDPLRPIWGNNIQLCIFPKHEHNKKSKSGLVSLVSPTVDSKRQQRLQEAPGRGVVKIRFGSEGKDKPDTWWSEFPVYIHRPLPTDGELKRADIIVKRVGPNTTYELHLTVRSEIKPIATGTGVACVNFGWRSLGNGVFRVAFLLDDQGHQEMCILPSTKDNQTRTVGNFSIVNRLNKKDDLKSFNEDYFNETLDVLHKYMKRSVSQKLKENTKEIAKWRSHVKLRKACEILVSESNLEPKLFLNWKQERLTNHQDLFASVQEVSKWCHINNITDHQIQLALYCQIWLNKQRHLYIWGERQSRKAINHRKQQYIDWSNQIGNKYQYILVDKYNMKEIKSVCEKGENEDHQTKRARKNRVNCAPGEARSTLIQKLGSKIILDNISNQTEPPSRKCTNCGNVSQSDLRDQIFIPCSVCGHVEDQDFRNCKNRLDSFLNSKFYRNLYQKGKVHEKASMVSKAKI